MELKQIADLLNNTIVPNVLGEGTTIHEDLSDLSDLGVAVENLTADQLKDYTKGFVAGVTRTYFDDRIFNKTIKGMFRDYADFGGIIQRIKAGLSQVTDDVSQNLQNGVSYDPNVYVGFDHKNMVYTKDCGFELDWSISNNMWKSAFKSIAELNKLIAYIYNRAEMTMNVYIYSAEKACLRALIAKKAGDRVKLLTLYNGTYGTSLTADTALTDANFLKWVASVIVNLKRAVTDVNKKYNDGTIETFTPAENVSVTMLSLFATALEMNMTSGVYHKELVEIGNYDTVNFWQNSGDDILPDFAKIGEIDTELDDGTNVKAEYIIGVIRDEYSAFITAFPEAVTAQYNAKGDFTNYFRRIKSSYAVATNQSAIILTLE